MMGPKKTDWLDYYSHNNYKKSPTERLMLQKIRGENISRDAAPLIDDLNANGFSIVDIHELTLERDRFKEALPILLKWIGMMKNPALAETLVRAVSGTWARRVSMPTLLEKMRSERDSGNDSLTWAIGNALYCDADKTFVGELLEIIKDPTYGRARQMIILKIGIMKIKDAIDPLLSIIDQDGVTGHTIAALGYIGAEKSKPAIEKYLGHENAWIRKEAKNALMRIDKAQSRKGK